MEKAPERVNLAYTINSKSGQLELASQLEEFTDEDRLLFNTGADLVKTSIGFYKLVAVFADRYPVSFYRGYEYVENFSVKKTR